MILDSETFFPEVLSTTQDIELFTQCPHKWYLKRCLKLHKYSYNSDLEAGGEFAKAMEITRNAYYKEGKSEKEAIELGKTSILESYGATYAEQKYPDTIKTPEKITEIFTRMFEEHPLDFAAIIPFEMSDGKLSVEQDFSIHLPYNHPETGKPLILKCKLDMLGMKDNIVYVVDEKTAKSVLTDSIKQTDLLRTQNQFVQYVTVANKCKEKFGNLTVTHVRINKCVIKAKYAKDEEVIHPYEFVIDAWFQKTWWNNMLYLVKDMLNKYDQFLTLQQDYRNFQKENQKQAMEQCQDKVIFPRAYGLSCTSFFKPCPFTSHCTSSLSQDIFEEGYRQIVKDSRTAYEEIPLKIYKQQRLTEVKNDD